jgi:phosphoribosylformylglycinamidine cyclo-ligase
LSKSYKDAGVDIDAADESIRSIKMQIRSTFSSNVLTDIGLFGGFFRADFSKFTEPVLVSSVDGVGTKLNIAVRANKHDTIGSDLVNHCVNDIAVSGAVPLFFMDYFAAGKLSRRVFEDVIRGFVAACRDNGCALIGGETAEMPGMYRNGDYDIAGMIVGVVDKPEIINGSAIRAGDAIIGVPSNGLHTNGYSLARAVLFDRYDVDGYIEEIGCTLGEELLKVHRSYLGVIQHLIANAKPGGLAHITGGGIVGNTTRILPEGVTLHIDWSAWQPPPIFGIIRAAGSVQENEMRKVFNMGVGLTVIVPPKTADRVLEALRNCGEEPFVIGTVVRK